MAPHLRRFEESGVAKERLRIIRFYTKYGERATKEAFSADRKLVCVWKKRLKESRGKLSSLVPYPTAPKNTRKRIVHPKVFEFIKLLREEHPRLGKEKIKPILDEYCLKEDLPIYSESKIGRIIKDARLFYQKNTRTYHNPASGYAKRKKVKRLRVRYSPKHTELGHIQMDTIVKIVDGVRYYLYSAIDAKGKFVLSLPYPRLTSKNTLDFFKKLELVYPGKIKSVQTDNGLEFLGALDQCLRLKGIPHYFIYPRCPKINSVIERYQRSLQEEFIDPNIHLIHNPKLFSSKLADYLIFFLTRRVHKSLGNIPPMDYMILKGGMSKKYWTYTKERFDPVLSQFLAKEIQETQEIRPEVVEFVEIATEFVLAGGKRLRPAFLSAGHKVMGGENESLAIKAGMAVELLHAAALVHDDIIDNSELRRGRPTVRRVIADRFDDEGLGDSLAIIVGDTLLAMANKVASSINEDRPARAYFDQMCAEINLGLYLDILGDTREKVDLDWVMKVMEYKTVRYTVEKPLLIGASLGGASSEKLEVMSGYAIPLGIAFQIQDDILGMFGDEGRVGKPVDSDPKEGKKTLLTLETIQRLKESRRELELERLKEILGNPNLSMGDYLWVQELIIETGALEKARETACNLKSWGGCFCF